MSCNRCDDIHVAQLQGLTQKRCECDCHNDYSVTDITGATTTTGTTLNWTSDLSNNAGGSWINFNNANIDPTSGAVDATLNYGKCPCCGGYHG